MDSIDKLSLFQDFIKSNLIKLDVQLSWKGKFLYSPVLWITKCWSDVSKGKG